MPTLVAITGPIASGKSTVAELLAKRCEGKGLTVVIADVDDVAAMVTGPGAAAGGLWFAAHLAHGAMVAQWVLSKVSVVIAVGPIYTLAEQEALFGPLPAEICLCRVLIDAPLSATWERARADLTRGRSREYDFHVAAHERFRSLMPDIPSDLVFNSGATSPDDIADAIWRAVDLPSRRCESIRRQLLPSDLLPRSRQLSAFVGGPRAHVPWMCPGEVALAR